MSGTTTTRRRFFARITAMLAVAASGGNALIAEDAAVGHVRISTEVRRESDPLAGPLLELQLASSDESAAPQQIDLSYEDLEAMYQLVAADEFEDTDADVFQVVPFYAPNPGDVFQNVSQDTAIQPLMPAPVPVQTQSSAPTSGLSAQVFGQQSQNSSLLSELRRSRSRNRGSIFVFGEESKFRATSDAADLLRKSNSALGVSSQRRNAITTEPKIRGGRVGQLVASGSYWFPARQDLDTLISKIDSRIVSDLEVVRGPYSALYGPGYDFIDVELLSSPRYEDGAEIHGSTSLEYKTNGQQWYGRQSIWGGDDKFGYRVSYGHKVGSDYQDGNGNSYPGSYNSRDLDVALGYDIAEDSHLEFNYLKLDQTSTEFPGQILDIDYLGTNALELTWTREDVGLFDRQTFEVWYITNNLKGSATSPAKQKLHPFLTFAPFAGPPFNAKPFAATSDVENLSTGYTSSLEWDDGFGQNTFGVDMRFLTQSIDQFQNAFFFAPNTNFPLPKAQQINPGIFYERFTEIDDQFSIRAGGRFDILVSDARNSAQGTQLQQGSVLDGTLTDDLEKVLEGKFNRTFTLGQAFMTSQFQVDENWTTTSGLGFGMRAPTMTELYSVGPLLSIVPQFLPNIMVGNPRLKSEKRYQIDVGVNGSFDNVRVGGSGFYAFIQDYITLEHFNPPGGVQFAWTNTDLATLAGFDFYSEWDATSSATLFGTMSYVEGRDLTRNSNATLNGGNTTGLRSQTNKSHEYLLGIAPLESHLGIRLHEESIDPTWFIEFSSRIVADQSKVARSLRELPTDAFTTFDLRGLWRASENLNVTAGVENLTNRQYQEHFDSKAQTAFVGPVPIGRTGNVYQPGVNFYFGTELKY